MYRSLLPRISLISIWIFFIFGNSCLFAKINNCGGIEEYDDEYRMCCNSKVMQKVEGQECCGRTKLYSTDKHVCCGGEVHPKFDNAETVCCSGKVYRAEEYICCNGNAVELSEKQKAIKDDLRCCDSETVINGRQEFCCGGKVFSKFDSLQCCDNVLISTKQFKCVIIDKKERKINPSQGVCGSEIYNFSEKSCCNEKLNNIPTSIAGAYNSERRCCNSEAYNPKHRFCCLPTYHTIPKEEDLFCCGNGFYNTTSEFCIDGKRIMQKPYIEQCGRHLYDNRTRSCCGNLEVYNPATHKCCEGRFISIMPKDKSCCNGLPLVEGKQICCRNDTPCMKEKPNDNECCYFNGKWKTYCSSENEICTTTNGVMKVDKGKKMCGHRLYDPKEEICCGNFALASRADGSNACCGHFKPFNTDTQICCSNYEVFNISSKSGSCCRLDRKAYRFDDIENPCSCNGKPMDTTTEKCCSGRIHNVGPNFWDYKCCGKRLLNINEKRCCGNRFSYKTGRAIQCCGDLDLYNTKYSNCERNDALKTDVVVPKAPYNDARDTQRLCSRFAFKGSDLISQHACLRRHVMVATVEKVTVKPRRRFFSFTLLLHDVKLITKEDKDSPLPRQIVINIRNNNEFKCRKRMFLKLTNKKVIIFHDKNMASTVKVGSHKQAHIHIALYSKRNWRLANKDDSQICERFMTDRIDRGCL